MGFNWTEAVKDIEKFNKIGGQLTNVDEDSINLQLSLGFEELSESITAFEERNPVELLDGAVDEFVIIVGKLLKLEAAGFDVKGAINEVNKNNLSKYIPCASVGGVRYNPEFTLTRNDEYDVYVLKDDNGKIRKPENYRSVDLSPFANKEFFKDCENV